MNTKYITLLFLALPLFIRAQIVPQEQMNINMNSVTFSAVNITGSVDAWAESPPLVKPGGMRSYYLSTHFSRLFPCNDNLAADNLTTLALPGWNSTVVSTPLTWWGGFRMPSSVPAWQWKRNYNGITSQHSLYIPGRGNVVIGFLHGENKNEKITSGNATWWYQNTINPNFLLDQSNPATYSGKVNGDYKDCWEGYYAFVGMSWTDDTQNNSCGNVYYNEGGPIAWPSNGYTVGGQKSSMGLRHPFSIVHNGYIYVYFQDTKWGGVEEEGRIQGLKVVRAPIANALNPNAYTIYYNKTWQPSLPSGFTVDNMMNFLGTKGPKSSIITGDGGTIGFKIAKIRNTDWFLGMEEVSGSNGSESLRWRLSKDLINWSEPKLTIFYSSSYASFPAKGAIFLDQTGWTNYEIDLNKFYVIGMTGSNQQMQRACYNITLVPVPTGPATGGGPGIEAGKKELEINLNNGSLLLKIDEKLPNKKVSIYNISGQLVKQESINGEEEHFNVNIHDLIQTPGLYVISVDTDNSHYSTKMIIQ